MSSGVLLFTCCDTFKWSGAFFLFVYYFGLNELCFAFSVSLSRISFCFCSERCHRYWTLISIVAPTPGFIPDFVKSQGRLHLRTLGNQTCRLAGTETKSQKEATKDSIQQKWFPWTEKRNWQKREWILGSLLAHKGLDGRIVLWFW